MPSALRSLLEEAREFLPDAIELRRSLHRRPELGLLLPETQRAVLGALAGVDVEIETGGATSAVIATLRGREPGPTLLLRADMDALPMPEETGLEFASEQAGAMHACGHDAHVAMLALAARLVSRYRDRLSGNIKFLFQPGEEGHGGARVLIGEGILERPPRADAAFAVHVNSSLRSGAVATRPGPLLAAGDVFSIELTGRGGHASMPHLVRDPIPVACEVVGALQTMITRRLDVFDPAVLTVTRIQAGTTHNVIPESAQILGTVRTISDTARERVRESMQTLVYGIAAGHELEAKVHFVPGYPVTVNHAGFVGFVRRVAADLMGSDQVIDMPAPLMGAEDFSYILQRLPGAMVFLGARPHGTRGEPLHSNRMVLDESAMATGIALHAAVALRYLEVGGSVAD